MVVCKGHETQPVPQTLRTAFSYELIHTNASVMADYAKQLARETHVSSVCLPFCHTVWSEFYGAKVTYGDWDHGPRIRASAELPTAFNLSFNTSFNTNHTSTLARTEIVLEALQKLHQDGVHTTLVLEGPFTILTNVLGFETTLRTFKKKPEQVHVYMTQICSDLTSYLALAKTVGIRELSFADPVAQRQLLGAKNFDQFILPYHELLATAMAEHINNGLIASICPVLAYDSPCFNQSGFKTACSKG